MVIIGVLTLITYVAPYLLTWNSNKKLWETNRASQVIECGRVVSRGGRSQVCNSEGEIERRKCTRVATWI